MTTMSKSRQLLIVGVGSIGHRHLRSFLTTGRVEAAICEPNTELRQRLAEQYRVRRTYADLEAALADHHDAAVIATPANLHIPMAIRLADSGVHLLIEKPLSTSWEGIEALQSKVVERGVVAAVAYVYRAHPALRAMKAALESGRFGRPVQLVAVCGQNFPTYRPAYREIYYRDRATGGGAIQDVLTHVLNAGEWLIGSVDRLLADAEHQVLDGVEVEDTVHVLTRHGGAMGSYSLNQHQAPNEITVTVICERGTLRFEHHKCRWRWMAGPDEPWHDEPAAPIERDTMFIAQANGFLDAVEGLAPPFCTLEDGIQTMRANLAALTSARSGTWQTIGTEARGAAR